MTTVDISFDVPRLEVVSAKGEVDELLVPVPSIGMLGRYELSNAEYSPNDSPASIRDEFDI